MVVGKVLVVVWKGIVAGIIGEAMVVVDKGVVVINNICRKVIMVFEDEAIVVGKIVFVILDKAMVAIGVVDKAMVITVAVGEVIVVVLASR